MLDRFDFDEPVGLTRFLSDESYDFETSSDLESSFEEVGINGGCRGGYSSTSSVDSECKLLRLELALDIDFISSMERQTALEMLKDKVQLYRDLKGLDRTSSSETTFKRLSPAERMEALQHVKERVRKIRQARKIKISPSTAKENDKQAVTKSRKPNKHCLSDKMDKKDAARPLRTRPLHNAAN